MLEVDVRPGEFREDDVARDDQVLGRVGPAPQPEAGRDDALIHHGVVGHRLVLAVVSRIGRSNILAYSRARRISSFDWTQSPSSVMATIPARLREPIGARTWPLSPTVMRPVG